MEPHRKPIEDHRTISRIHKISSNNHGNRAKNKNVREKHRNPSSEPSSGLGLQPHRPRGCSETTRGDAGDGEPGEPGEALTHPEPETWKKSEFQAFTATKKVQTETQKKTGSKLLGLAFHKQYRHAVFQ
jgi:hypothetical protein